MCDMQITSNWQRYCFTIEKNIIYHYDYSTDRFELAGSAKFLHFTILEGP